ncbi:hypothetical protein HCC61_25320 [Streptomyces sp. HNM0575]|uniref:hypothetical protein n=1 Tax=Streptomyces sp. HNM0575 TaxID=2716338 RepID=UPI00145ECB5B|nr:hypothetical protein [Streptomyces sp. HNM0575]NLU75932.1 hypothetical protein [Streptomyces sp. HNM0575]
MGLSGFTITEEFATAVVSLLPVIMLVGVVDLHQFHKKSYELEEELKIQPSAEAFVRAAARVHGTQLGELFPPEEVDEEFSNAAEALTARMPSVELWRWMAKAWLVVFAYMSVAELATLYWLGLPKSPSWVWLAVFDAMAVIVGLALLMAGHIKQMLARTREREQAHRQIIEQALRATSQATAERYGRRRSNGVGDL